MQDWMLLILYEDALKLVPARNSADSPWKRLPYRHEDSPTAKIRTYTNYRKIG